MIELITGNSVFGVLLSLLCYKAGMIIQRKTGVTFLQPILTCTIMIIVILKMTGIDYETYRAQNEFLYYMLPVTAVVLAVPLYKNINILKKHAFPIIAGILAGTSATIGSAVLIGKLLGTEKSIIISMIPKGVTNPIAIGISKIIGGMPEFTVALVVITGILGGSFGPEIISFLGIKNKVAKGIAMGSMCHAVGTARAFKEGELEGSMSGLAMAVAGIMTAVLAPIAVRLFF